MGRGEWGTLQRLADKSQQCLRIEWWSHFFMPEWLGAAGGGAELRWGWPCCVFVTLMQFGEGLRGAGASAPFANHA